MMIFLETLGCSRNQVDSEIMLGKLAKAGHDITGDPAKAGVIIVNTCGFISTASQEAVDTILELAQFKQTGACKRLIAMGCLAQRYKDDPDLVSTLPEVDVFLGTAACESIVDAVENSAAEQLVLFPDPNLRKFQTPGEKRFLSAEPFSYLKVSEGCNRKCTYCIIPTLRGLQRSRPVEDICDEALSLVEMGAQEIILTAENTTDWGRENSSRSEGFETVISAVSKALETKDAWIRYLYTHPQTLSRDIIKVTADSRNICSYYDVPIQHSVSRVLKRMGRPYTTSDLECLFNDIRTLDPEAAIRTTVIVGFPGETDDDFEQLLEFVKNVKFDHLGVFTYSDSQDLPSHSLKNHVPEEVAEKRHDILMQAQAQISQEINEKYVGRTYEVLVEENPEDGVYIGRTRFQAPEVDGVTFIYADGLEINTRVRVKVTDAYEYDIAGEI